MGSAYATISHMGKTLISASLALAALTDAQQRVKDAEYALTQARLERDELIRDAKRAPVPYLTIMRHTGLSRDRLIKIVNSPDARDPDGV